MREKGREVTVLEVIRAINDSIPDNFAHQADLERVAAALATMANSPQYRREKIDEVALDLKGLLRTNPNFLERLGK
jgi:hypothetical protein